MLTKLKWPPHFLLNCKKCPLCKDRKNLVVGRGTVGGLLFIGEAPGRVEDALGTPFIGPSGNLLDQMLLDSGIHSYYITNTVLCRPVDPVTNGDREPSFEEVLACRSNLESILLHVSPVFVCFIGKVSEQYLSSVINVPYSSVVHPSALLRRGGAGTFAYKEAVKKLRKVKEMMYEIKAQKN